MPVHVCQVAITDGTSGKVILNITVDYIIDRVELTSTGQVFITESSIWEEIDAKTTDAGITVETERELDGALVMEDLGTTKKDQFVLGLRNASGSTQKVDIQIQTIDKLQAVHKYGTVFMG